MEIGKMTIETVKMLVNELIDVHAEEIGKAFLKSGDDGVSVSGRVLRRLPFGLFPASVFPGM